jgi:hypothetical protein
VRLPGPQRAVQQQLEGGQTVFGDVPLPAYPTVFDRLNAYLPYVDSGVRPVQDDVPVGAVFARSHQLTELVPELVAVRPDGERLRDHDVLELVVLPPLAGVEDAFQRVGVLPHLRPLDPAAPVADPAAPRFGLPDELAQHPWLQPQDRFQRG